MCRRQRLRAKCVQFICEIWRPWRPQHTIPVVLLLIGAFQWALLPRVEAETTISPTLRLVYSGLSFTAPPCGGRLARDAALFSSAVTVKYFTDHLSAAGLLVSVVHPHVTYLAPVWKLTCSVSSGLKRERPYPARRPSSRGQGTDVTSATTR